MEGQKRWSATSSTEIVPFPYLIHSTPTEIRACNNCTGELNYIIATMRPGIHSVEHCPHV